ncbi:hypothetical protein CHS0354_002164, partial [Potamilus streckersoni]
MEPFWELYRDEERTCNRMEVMRLAGNAYKGVADWRGGLLCWWSGVGCGGLPLGLVRMI